MVWRKWLYGILTSDADVTEIIPAERWYPSANFKEVPPTLFGVYKLGPESHEIADATLIPAEVWVYDSPGSYTRIDDALKRIRDAVISAPADDGMFPAEWAGDSEDLSDDEMGTIFRTASFQLRGRFE